MSYESFYRYIVEENGKYRIIRKNQDYGLYNTLEDALYERDRLIKVDWDWELSMNLPETINGYIHIDLPPFEHISSHISVDSECWIVRDKGKNRRYRGTYYTFEEAKKVAMIYNANISHKNKAYRIVKKINGRTVYFGRCKTREEAEARVKELKKNNWRKDESNQ